MRRLKILTLGLALAAVTSGLPLAYADIVAPQAPPELSDTLKDYRTKEQLSEHVYIEGKIDTSISLQVGTTVGDLEGRVLRLSAAYQPQYVIAIPQHGVSLLRFYDLHGMPLEIVSTRSEYPGYQAEITASPSELLIRQLQDGPVSLLQVRLKGVNQNLIFRLKPLMLVNQQHSVRTLITAMTVNYYMEAPTVTQTQEDTTEPISLDITANYDDVDSEHLRDAMLHAAALVLPLTLEEQEKGRQALAQEESLEAESISLQAIPTVITDAKESSDDPQ